MMKVERHLSSGALIFKLDPGEADDRKRIKEQSKKIGDLESQIKELKDLVNGVLINSSRTNQGEKNDRQ